MTASIPSSFNPEELQELLDAKKNETGELTSEQMIATAEYCVDRALEEAGANSAVVHKLMVLMITQRFIEWHTNCSERMFDDDQTNSAICWARDAGKFQAIATILDGITVGPDDFMSVDGQVEEE